MSAKKTSGEREALIEAAIAHLRADLEAQLPGDTATFAEIEAAAGRIGSRAAADLKQRLRERAPETHKEETP